MPNLYIAKPGKIVRKHHTLYFIDKDGNKRALPIERIESIYLLAPVSISSQILLLLGNKGIEVHFFDMYGNYEGSFLPREKRVSGDLVIRQSEHFINREKRLYLAKRFVEGALLNVKRVLSQYNIEFEPDLGRIEGIDNVRELMGFEGEYKRKYYSLLDSILPEQFRIRERSRRPPSNMGNALLSFGYSLLYSEVLNQIRRTPLHPGISYLHEPYERRFSLALDIAEIFKPFIVDRLILYLVNKKILKEHHFEGDIGNVLLNNEGKAIFLRYWEEKLRSTIRHRKLRKNVSYRKLIHLEVLKLVKHLLGMEKYQPLVIWW